MRSAPFILFTLFILAFSSNHLASSNFTPQKKPSPIEFVEIVPLSDPEYTVSGEFKQIRHAIQMAQFTFNQMDKKCRPPLNLTLKHGTEEELSATIKTLSQRPDQPLIVGLSRSNFARLAAEASKGSPVKGISIGAATSNLHSINERFISIASPWQKQWAVIKTRLKLEHCSASNSAGIFNPKNFLSSQFQGQFKVSYPKIFEQPDVTPDRIAELLKGKTCLFMGINFSDAQPYLQNLIHDRWKGVILGVGDWNYYAAELKATLKDAPPEALSLFAPTGWSAPANPRSREFAADFNRLAGESPSPVAAYTYDSLLLALSSACSSFNPTVFNPEHLKKLPLLRNYLGLSDSGNYLSEMYLVDHSTRR